MTKARKRKLEMDERIRQTHKLTGEDAFFFYQTYGLPLEYIVSIMAEKGVTVDTEGFWQEFEKHKSKSRVSSKFSGVWGSSTSINTLK